MKPNDLVLRCYAIRRGNVWEAYCVDLCLAAHSDSFQNVKKALHAQIHEYIYDALTKDKEHADYFLNRKASVFEIAIFYAIGFLGTINNFKNGFKSFRDSLPLLPAPAI
jgi:heterodisulfide reductase subunit A-like polyferredoxin